MAPNPEMSTTSMVPSPTLSANVPEVSQTGLPGMKRGIAIGVACSVTVLLIGLLAFFAIRRRKHVLSRRRNSEDKSTAPNYLPEVWPQDKTWRVATPPPLVEADTRTIYEMDANQIPELPHYADVQEMDTDRRTGSGAKSNDEGEAYAHKLHQWKTWSIVLEDEPKVRSKPSPQLPLLTISPPEDFLGDVSPLLPSTWDTSPLSASPLSPLPDAHLSSRHNEHWNH